MGGWGVKDFAGGIVVHTTAGFSALAGTYVCFRLFKSLLTPSLISVVLPVPIGPLIAIEFPIEFGLEIHCANICINWSLASVFVRHDTVS